MNLTALVHGFITKDVQHPLQRQHGDAAFFTAHHPDQLKSFGEGSSGLMKHDARRQRRLIATGFVAEELCQVYESLSHP